MLTDPRRRHQHVDRHERVGQQAQRGHRAERGRREPPAGATGAGAADGFRADAPAGPGGSTTPRRHRLARRFAGRAAALQALAPLDQVDLGQVRPVRPPHLVGGRQLAEQPGIGHEAGDLALELGPPQAVGRAGQEDSLAVRPSSPRAGTSSSCRRAAGGWRTCGTARTGSGRPAPTPCPPAAGRKRPRRRRGGPAAPRPSAPWLRRPQPSRLRRPARREASREARRRRGPVPCTAQRGGLHIGHLAATAGSAAGRRSDRESD